MSNEKINLNNEEFDNKDVQVINGGKAGEIVADFIRVEKNEAENNEPNYKVFLRDSSGSEVNEGFYYVDLGREYGKKTLVTQGKRLKHYCQAVIPDWEIPEFDSPKDMLDKIMMQLRNKCQAGPTPVKLGLSFGTTQKASTYIGVKRTIPFILPASSDKGITFSAIDVTEAPEPTTISNSSDTASSSDDSSGGW